MLYNYYLFGKRSIVFASNRGNDNQWATDIHVMDPNGRNHQKLTNAGSDVSPSWSPDGQRIVFVSYRDENAEIYVMDADGGNPQRLTDSPADDWSPSWSPDGERIVFSSERDGNFEIYLMDADGENPRRLTNHPDRDFLPSWSPDGKRIAFASNRVRSLDIYVIDADGQNLQNLTNVMFGHDSAPAWFHPTLGIAPAAVAPVGKKLTIWGQLKRVDQ